jgi:phosphosulfolactate synthase (CoM biosynthesis protein A)
MHMADPRPFEFLEINQTPAKPRQAGLTEIRGPLYSTLGPTQLSELLSMTGRYVDVFKFAGGAVRLMPLGIVKEFIRIAHYHEVLVSTGGFTEHVVGRRGQLMARYLDECRMLGFDVVEISANYLSMSERDLLRLVGMVLDCGMKAKPEVGIQFGTGGGVMSAADLAEVPTGDVDRMLRLAEAYLDRGAWKVMIESEGITENVTTWRTDIISTIVSHLGLENVMFEAADPKVYGWFIQEYGPDVNLFVDHSQALHLATFRAGVGGGRQLWGRVVTIDQESTG